MLLVWALWLSWWTPVHETNDVEQALARGEYRVALNRLAGLTPRDARWHLLASKAWDGLNDPAKAVAEAEEALKLDPGKPVYHVHVAQIFLSRNTPKAALEIFSEADMLFPGNFVIRLGKGLALKELQLYDEAERELLWCLDRQPGAALAFDALATIYIHLSRYSDANKLTTAFMKQNAEDYRGYYFLAAARDGEQLPGAETRGLLAESIRRNPNFAAAHALTGKILLREENAAEALKYLRRAVELRPDLVQAHLHLGRALRATGDEAAAAREFETVRQLKAKEQEPVPALLYHRGSRQ
jgi:tetratricopeptide (TPR) repeat protein